MDGGGGAREAAAAALKTEQRLRDLKACFDMITTLPARLMNAAHYGVAVGHPADLVVLDSRDPALAVAEVAQPLFGLKRGRRSFTRAAATIHRP